MASVDIFNSLCT